MLHKELLPTTAGFCYQPNIRTVFYSLHRIESMRLVEMLALHYVVLISCYVFFGETNSTTRPKTEL